MEKEKIIIDCDPGSDDALAIILALYSGKLDLKAVCSVTGNGALDTTTRNGLNILSLCGREDIPLYRGSAVALDQKQPETVSAFGDDGLGGFAHTIASNKKDFSDNYNLVYGHHMANGGMFGDVVSFTEKSYFDKHKTGELYLPDKTMHIDLFACMKTSASDSKVYNPQNISKTSESFKSFLDYVREAAICYRDSGRQDTGQIIGLSTCSEAVTNGRVILFGRLSEVTKSNQKQKKAE